MTISAATTLTRRPTSIPTLVPCAPSAKTLPDIDRQFWTAAIALSAIPATGHATELQRVHVCLLLSLDPSVREPASLTAAVRLYRQLRSGAECRFGIRVDRAAQAAALAALEDAGYEL